MRAITVTPGTAGSQRLADNLPDPSPHEGAVLGAQRGLDVQCWTG